MGRKRKPENTQLRESILNQIHNGTNHLNEIAEALNKHPLKIHNYLKPLTKHGYLEQTKSFYFMNTSVEWCPCCQLIPTIHPKEWCE